ncbi:MAG: TatD family hydrolase [Spirochaetales bacterium]|nr:TatD family hydrolase [Spirochaetales bacterium]
MDINIRENMSDSHFHIMEMIRKGLEPESVFEALKNAGAGYLLDAGVILDDFEERLVWKKNYEKLFFAAGIHPNIPAEQWPENYETTLETQITHPLVKAVGETGLDFFREFSSLEDQYRLLNLHYKLAGLSDKPLIFHIRNAEAEMQEWISARDFPMGAVLHCFPGDLSLAETALEKGFYISFAGNVTFKNAQPLRDALQIIPLERLLIETDAPYLAPHPKRGRNNHPGLIGYSYECIASEKKISLQQLTETVDTNLKNLLRIQASLP